jgi:aminoglycoside/choline kinase family phosphotransferase
VDGARDFNPRRTHNPPRYDVRLMRRWESGYFVRELLAWHLGIEPPGALDGELDRLAARAAEAGAEHLLHRDYQSQNLKLHLGRLAVIDFQGARLGPPQYDLAALLYDPYADLPTGLRGKLLEHYLDVFTGRTGEDRGRLLEHFPAVAAHRLLQALGAYAFLGGRRGKMAFLAHIPVALRLLGEVLGRLPPADIQHLAAVVRTAERRVAPKG